MGEARLRDDAAAADDFADELAPGSELMHGQYKIEAFLNAGGFGITYAARDSLDRRVVIKECFPGAFCRRSTTLVNARSRAHQKELASIVRLFVQEARSLAKLAHPNIVGVHQVFEENNTAYMALDFIEGSDLLDIIEEGERTLRPTQIEDILRKLLDAIGFIHEQGILHRDISPDNILIDETGKPVLIDFGAAREEATKQSRVLSTLRVVKDGYSPQEFYIQGSDQGPYSDLYALAASFYHLISGELPPNSQARLAEVVMGEGDPYRPLAGRVEGFGPQFLEALDQALAILPKDRIASAQDWLDIIDGKAPLAPTRDHGPAAAPASRAAALPGAAVQEPKRSGTGKLLAGVAVVALAGAAVVVTQTDLLGTPGGSSVETTADAVPEPEAGAPDAATSVDGMSVVALPPAADTIGIDADRAAAALAPATDPAPQPRPQPAPLRDAPVAGAAPETPAAPQRPESAGTAALATTPAEDTAGETGTAVAGTAVAGTAVAGTAEAETAEAGPTDTGAAAPADPLDGLTAERIAPATDPRLVTPAQGAARPATAGAAAPALTPANTGASARAPNGIATPDAAATVAASAAPRAGTLPEFARAAPPARGQAPAITASPLSPATAQAALARAAARDSAAPIFAARSLPTVPAFLAERALGAPSLGAAPATPARPVVAAPTTLSPLETAEDRIEAPGMLSGWAAQLPFAGLFDSIEGESRIFAVNGVPVDTRQAFDAAVRETAQPGPDDSVSVTVRIGVDAETATEQAWTLPLKQQTILVNGLSFETTRESGAWTTRVIDVPTGLAAELAPGDVVIGYVPTGDTLDGRTSLTRLIAREIDAGASSLQLAIARGDAVWALAIPLPQTGSGRAD